jgi:hypothetical protein
MDDRTLTAKVTVPKLASRRLMQRFGIHPKDPEAVELDMAGTSALCIATNHAVLDIGVATGVFASELTVPYYHFLDAGMQVDVASPLGGIIPVDPMSMNETIRTSPARGGTNPSGGASTGRNETWKSHAAEKPASSAPHQNGRNPGPGPYSV